MHKTSDSLWDKIWYDRDGKVVIYQNPNRYLIAWVILAFLSMFNKGVGGTVLWYASLAVLAFWCVLEMWKGVNYFRRAFGAFVLILVILAVFRLG